MMTANLPFCCVFLISLLTTASCVCPNGWTIWDGECYKLYPVPTNWLDAGGLCRSFGGHLATLNTTAKIKNAKEFLAELSYNVNIWVGANDLRSESIWKWDVDQSSFSATDWSAGEPNHGSDENCLMLMPSKQYKWADAPCKNTYHFLCDRKSLPM